jgi:hypothetical protein
MADDASRIWHLSDSAFLSYCNQRFPQQQSWFLRSLRSKMKFAVISALYKKWSTLESFLAAVLPPARTGQSGPPSVSSLTKPRKNWTVWTTFCVFPHQDPLLLHVADKIKFLQSLPIVPALVHLPATSATNRSSLEKCRTTSALSVRA